MTTQAKRRPMFDSHIMRRALLESFRKLDPRLQIRNPVMFVVLVGSVLTTVLLFRRCSEKAKRLSGLSLPSLSGSGSPCCSQTLPKRWRKGAEKHRRNRCAVPGVK